MPLPTSYVGSGQAFPVILQHPHSSEVMSVQPAIIKETFTNPSTIDADGISASHAGAATAGTTNMTIGGALASGGVATLTPARNVVITVTHGSSVVAMSGVISGTDVHGNAITENWSVTAGTTSKTFTGNKAFKTVTGITEVVAADASANTIVAGDGKKLGLSYKAADVTLITETEDGAIPTAGVLVAASSAATTDARGTYTPNSTLNGALDFVIRYLTETAARS